MLGAKATKVVMLLAAEPATQHNPAEPLGELPVEHEAQKRPGPASQAQEEH